MDGFILPSVKAVEDILICIFKMEAYIDIIETYVVIIWYKHILQPRVDNFPI